MDGEVGLFKKAFAKQKTMCSFEGTKNLVFSYEEIRGWPSGSVG